MVGVDHADDGHAQLAGLGDGDLVIADVNDEQRVRQAVQVLDAAQAGGQLGQFTGEEQRFLLGHLVQGAVFHGLFHVLQALDGALDRLEVGEHAAQPTLVDVGHAGACSFFGDDLARLALGAHEQDGAAIGCQLTQVAGGFLVFDQGLFQVDDVNLVAMAEDVGGHARVPEPGLVSEVDTGFEHLADGD